VDDAAVNPVAPADFELLSAYVDDQLAPAERAALEARLAAEPELRAALDDLRALVAGLRTLPDLRAPRDLRLTAAQVQPRRRILPLPAFASGLSAVAAALLLTAGVVLLRPTPLTAPADEQAVAAAPTSAALATMPLASPAARQAEPTVSPARDDEGLNAGSAAPAETTTGTDLAQEGGAVDAPGLADSAQAAESAPQGFAPPVPTQAPQLDSLNMADLAAPSAAVPEQTERAGEETEEAQRTKESTPTPSPTASATPTPTSPPAVTLSAPGTPEVRGASVSLTGVALIAGGVVLLGVSWLWWRRARRGR
jgi:anti-sigma factor RsiW